MKAAMYYGPGDIRVEERPEPEPAADNMICEIICCAICGSDLKMLSVGDPRSKPPRVIGHELAARLVHVGERVKGFDVGDRVTLATTIACGECACCKRALGNMCPNNAPISRAFDGGFAEKMVVPPPALAGGNAVKVPENVADEAAALSEPLSCCINAQALASVKADDKVVIVGGGPLGALHAQLAKAKGAAEVMIAQRSEPRLSLLRKLEGVTVIDGNDDVPTTVRDHTEGLGADVVIICAPTREAHEQSIHLARKGGTVSLFASLPKGESDINIDSRTIHYGELRIVGSSDSRPEHVREAIRLMAEKRIDVSPIVTHKLPLVDIHQGLKLMKQKESFKILIYPGKEDNR